MKKVISFMIILLIIIQGIVLYMFFSDKLASYQENIINTIWIGSAVLGTLFGILYFRVNKESKIPINTASIIAIAGLIAFPFLLFRYWLVVFGLFILALSLHFYKYRENKFTIFPVLSTIIGVYSGGVYFLMRWITSM
ncbi:hypothetical protein [Clostridium sp. YIM B02551]|uniref:hypothetical protein n=1 Tax=Clostridium sp. YIM B02551 TaxID=2910679 RepID=UPI001EEA96EE|nr:hypothetical protein [Clostridium sp. YIM B02551]